MTRLKQGAAIGRWLTDRGFTFKMGVDGYPVLLKSHVERVMSEETKTKAKPAPDMEALRRRLENGKEARSAPRAA